MSATRITWTEWYLTASSTAAHAHRAQVERAHPSAILGPEHWTLTGALTPAPRRHPRPATRGRATPTAPRCAVCGRPIREGAPIGIRNAQPLHLRPCVDEYDAAHPAPATTNPGTR